MCYLTIANYIDLLTIYSNQIHDLIIVLKSDPDSVVKNNCNNEILSQLIQKLL